MIGYFYLTGIIAGISISGFVAISVALFFLKKRHIKLSEKINKLTKENNTFKEDNDKRICRHTSKGWYKTKDKDDPNKYTWDVHYDLRKVSTSEDRRKSKFEIISITSGNIKDPEDCTLGSHYFVFYRDQFLKVTGDGWLSNSEVEWVIDLPPDAIRDKKLKELGI